MVELRQPAVHEVETLVRLDREIFGKHSYPLIAMRQFRDLAGPLLIVAIEDAELLGYALVLPSFVKNEGWFMALGVREDHRRTGIGEALAERVISEAEGLGIEILKLTVEPTNHGAIALYKRLGFEPQEVAANYFGRGEDRQVMRRQEPTQESRHRPETP